MPAFKQQARPFALGLALLALLVVSNTRSAQQNLGMQEVRKDLSRLVATMGDVQKDMTDLGNVARSIQEDAAKRPASTQLNQNQAALAQLLSELRSLREKVVQHGTNPAAAAVASPRTASKESYHEYNGNVLGVNFRYLLTNRRHLGVINDHLKREKEGYAILQGAIKELQNETAPSNDQPPLIIDVGSNHGLYSLFAASLGADVVAVEPQKWLVDLIRRAAHLNGLSYERHIQVYQYGALDSREAVTMADHQIGEGAVGRLVRGGGAAADASPITTRFIDDFIPTTEKRDISFLKVDVEGFEIQALLSASKLFGDSAGRVRNVLVEFGPPSRWSRASKAPSEGVSILRDMRNKYGFEPRLIPSFAWEHFHKKHLIPGGGKTKYESPYGFEYVPLNGNDTMEGLIRVMEVCDCESYIWFAFNGTASDIKQGE